MKGKKETEPSPCKETFLGAPGTLRTKSEQEAGRRVEEIFLKCPKSVGINNLEIQRVEFDPYIGYAVVG